MENQTEQKKRLNSAKEIASWICGLLSLIMVISFFAVCSSVFVFIWGTFVLSIKVLFTGVFSLAFAKFFHFVVSSSMKKVEEQLKQIEDKTV